MRRLGLFLVVSWLALFGAAHGQLTMVTTFGGTASETTAFFQVADKWELQLNCPNSVTVTVLAEDGTAVAGFSAKGNGTIFLNKGGKYKLQVTMAPGSDEQWDISLYQIGPATHTDFALAGGAPSASAPSTNAAPASILPFQTNAPPLPPPASATADTGSLTPDQAHAVVLIKGDHGEGTGFFVKGPDGPAVITDQHVLAGNPNVQIFTTTGEQVKTLGLKGASDRDLAMISIQDNHYSYLQLATDIANTVQNGDILITPGDSEGGEVMLDTRGEVRGIGPEYVEMSNPFFHGNSGGPVVHLKSGRVLAAVEGAKKVTPTDSLDSASLASHDSAITGSMRYFGVRVDNVPRWDAYDWPQFLNETTFISNFHDQTRCLDAFMNGGNYERAHVASLDENGHPPVRYYLKNAKLVAIQQNFHQMSTDADNSQRMDAAREMVMDLQGFANTGLDTMQNPNNFYPFDQIRAKEEVAYRQALLKEIDNAGDKISDMGH